MKFKAFTILLLFLGSLAISADFYVSPNGSGNGNSWQSPMGLSGVLQRGSTYWLADGSYGSYEFITPYSAAGDVIIRKATVQDHGSDTGWQDEFGDGKALFIRIRILDPNIQIIGSRDDGFYNIHIQQNANTAALDIRNDDRYDASNVYIENVEIEHAGMDMVGYNNGDAMFFWGGDGDWLENLTFVNCYVHDATRTLILARNTRNVDFTSVVFENCQNNVGIHGEGVSWDTTYGNSSTENELNLVWKNCIWKDIEGAGVIVIGLQHGSSAKWHSNIQISGNIFYSTASKYTITDGVIVALADNDLSDVSIYNNTFAFLNPIGNFAFIFNPDASANDTNNHAVNNIIYSWSSEPAWSSSGVNHDYNLYYISGRDISEAHLERGQRQPNFESYNFYLNTSTASGLVLSGEYNTDYFGQIRGSDGIWDKGAIEYSGDMEAGEKPKKLKVR